MNEFEIAIIGGGLAGSVAALALSTSGGRVALVAPRRDMPDGRTTALMDQSIGLLRDLELWDTIAPSAAPLETMRILDGTSRLFRAPPVSFRASEVGLSAFGYNIPNAPLAELLESRIATTDTITRFDYGADAVDTEPDAAKITLANGDSLRAQLVVGADGRGSLVRQSAGIGVRTWSYPQTAIVLNFSHSLPHDNISTEFHTESGPFTQVPLPGNRSSLVWVQSPRKAEEMLELPQAKLSEVVEERMQSILGKVTVETIPQAYPLSGMIAHRFGRERTALVGEAAHAFPPIGAQGLNLSLRDIMALRKLLGDSTTPDLGKIGDRFDRHRQADVRSRTMSVDLLNRSLLSGFLPVQILRSAGLHLLSAMGPLRSVAMREGIEPGGSFKAFRDSLRKRIAGQKA
ncbi:UbiH/UbiF family hydroxylase [Sinorhizobium sp. BG8]|uniref:UbiH/UbiF family hydroxylase n=1 Tax=Sinorhizobium sp. BG8 TaxID=2613773 RepID=UPI00193D5394|nr:UbiH/UbiF family hydroxylase [Sinorhizobium sp. BG8]QRM56933.1 UbiH/UbiF family hydroxylase [Sinorhizobium sp. BG8]